MSRSRALIVFVCLVVAVAVATTPSGAQDSEVQALKQRVEALERRLAAMEVQMRQLAQGGGGANPLEGEATAALNEISRTAVSDQLKAKEQMTEFMSKYGSTNAARQASGLRVELAVVGKPAPTDWGIDKWFQGESEVNLSAKNKTTVLVFWETWCPHCQREVPKLDALYNALKGDGLQLVGLTKLTKSSTDEKVQEFIKNRGVSYPVAKEDGSASRHFGVSGIPAAAVVKDGKVIWRGHPARLTNARVKAWL